MKLNNMSNLIEERKKSQDLQDELFTQIKQIDKIINDTTEIQKQLNYKWNKEDEDLRNSRYSAFFSEKNAESKNNYRSILYQLNDSKSFMQKELKKQRERESEISFKILKEKEKEDG